MPDLLGFGTVTVTSTGSLPATVTYTITFTGVTGYVSQLTSCDQMTGSSHSIAHAIATTGVPGSLLMTSGKVICYGNSVNNKDIGPVYLVNIFAADDTTPTYADRAILFATDGERPSSYEARAH